MAMVEVVLPVLNEAKVLERSVRALHAFLADNGSTDATFDIGTRLSKELSSLECRHIPEAGRGRALSLAWLASDADVLAYMDIDLSTDLGAFPRLGSLVADQGYDVAAGTRLGKGSETERSLKREVLSRGFVFLINVAFGTTLRDT